MRLHIQICSLINKSRTQYGWKGCQHIVCPQKNRANRIPQRRGADPHGATYDFAKVSRNTKKNPVKLHEIENILDRRGGPRSANENNGVVCVGGVGGLTCPKSVNEDVD